MWGKKNATLFLFLSALIVFLPKIAHSEIGDNDANIYPECFLFLSIERNIYNIDLPSTEKNCHSKGEKEIYIKIVFDLVEIFYENKIILPITKIFSLIDDLNCNYPEFSSSLIFYVYSNFEGDSIILEKSMDNLIISDKCSFFSDTVFVSRFVRYAKADFGALEEKLVSDAKNSSIVRIVELHKKNGGFYSASLGFLLGKIFPNNDVYSEFTRKNCNKDINLYIICLQKGDESEKIFNEKFGNLYRRGFFVSRKEIFSSVNIGKFLFSR